MDFKQFGSKILQSHMNIMSFKTNKSVQCDNEDTLWQENKEHNCLRFVTFQIQTCFWQM